MLYTRSAPTPQGAAAQLALEVESLSAADAEDAEAFRGALRRAKRRVTFEVGLADLAGELSTWEAGRILTGLADATLEAACRFALRERAPGISLERPGLVIAAMGKLGGREIGYGSDLDVFFIYEGDDERGGAQELFARVAVRVLQLVGAPHGEGPGYALDTRLRPSGNQGLLVASLAGFERYSREQAADWERQALVKARICAGDKALGAAVARVAESVALREGSPDPEGVDHLRGRMEREIGHERRDRSPARYDVKVGRGGLVDVEFATQWLQMRHGRDARVRTTETGPAITALETCGYLDAASAEGLRRAWGFLRKLEQRMRVAHGASVSLLQEGAPGLLTIARSMGARDGPRARADAALLEQYVAVTANVRSIYQRLRAVARLTAQRRTAEHRACLTRPVGAGLRVGPAPRSAASRKKRRFEWLIARCATSGPARLPVAAKTVPKSRPMTVAQPIQAQRARPPIWWSAPNTTEDATTPTAGTSSPRKSSSSPSALSNT